MAIVKMANTAKISSDYRDVGIRTSCRSDGADSKF